MNKELLTRIERLEQAVQDIWASCACLNKEPGEDTFNCEPPTCEDCGREDCSCFLVEEPEEAEEEPMEEGEHD